MFILNVLGFIYGFYEYNGNFRAIIIGQSADENS